MMAALGMLPRRTRYDRPAARKPRRGRFAQRLVFVNEAADDRKKFNHGRARVAADGTFGFTQQGTYARGE